MARLSIMLKLVVKDKVKPENFSLDYLVFDYEGNELPICPTGYGMYIIEEDGEIVLNIKTGRGLFDDFELEDCYDDIYEDIGIYRSEITAEFLANTDGLLTVGCYSDADITRVKAIKFIDVDTGKHYEYEDDYEKCDIYVCN